MSFQPAAAQQSDRSKAGGGGDDLRHLEAAHGTDADALRRPGQGRQPDVAYRHGLQPASLGGHHSLTTPPIRPLAAKTARKRHSGDDQHASQPPSQPSPRIAGVPFMGRVSREARRVGYGRRGAPPWPASRPVPPHEGEGEVSYSTILATTPAPTVRPPSRMAKRRPWSMAIGVISSTSSSALSPGMIISTPSRSLMMPVTSVVRK